MPPRCITLYHRFVRKLRLLGRVITIAQRYRFRLPFRRLPVRSLPPSPAAVYVRVIERNRHFGRNRTINATILTLNKSDVYCTNRCINDADQCTRVSIRDIRRAHACRCALRACRCSRQCRFSSSIPVKWTDEPSTLIVQLLLHAHMREEQAFKLSLRLHVYFRRIETIHFHRGRSNGGFGAQLRAFLLVSCNFFRIRRTIRGTRCVLSSSLALFSCSRYFFYL